jgi:hypothetical protein
MFVLVIADNHRNGNHHSGDDEEDLNRIGEQMNRIKYHPSLNVSHRAADVMIQTNTNGREASETMNNGEIGLH